MKKNTRQLTTRPEEDKRRERDLVRLRTAVRAGQLCWCFSEINPARKK